MSERVLVPGPRDVRASLDGPADTSSVEADPSVCVVACPPHPQLGGSRSDRRLVAVADALGERGVACLRIDYGPWDEGRGECRDARAALSWTGERYATVGAFGYSFGGTVALAAAARARSDDADAVTAVSALAPASTLGGTENGRDDAGVAADALTALDALDCPVQIVYGERDETVDWRPVVQRARERGFAVESMPADHHFVGQAEAVGQRVGDFLADALR